MCGLVGFLGAWGELGADAQTASLLKMSEALVHRGPDDQGYWFDQSMGVGLAHRRLSIIDLSVEGHQPMTSETGRFVIAYNGEIYNHLDLRAELSTHGRSCERSYGNRWRGHSDTETLLACIEAWGIDETVKKCNGMFAFAVWDRKLSALTLARDRFGEKPIYYGWQGCGPPGHQNSVFLFASETKALKQHPAFKPDVDRGALCLFMRHGYIPSPYSIYKGISKLEPGSLLTVTSMQPHPNVRRYWSVWDDAVASGQSPLRVGAPEAVLALENTLMSAVRRQMSADVPLGAFLSGGIDSSTIVALMQRQSTSPIKTFTIGFEDSNYNEAEYAKRVAQYLQTDHTELYVSSAQALEVIPRLPKIYCEPFADSSQIPTVLVSHLAGQHVKVALSGDAGDELFGGYTRYVLTERLWKTLSRIPPPLRSLVAASILAIPPAVWDGLAGRLRSNGPRGVLTNLGDRLHKAAGVVSAGNENELYGRLISQWSDPAQLVVAGVEPGTKFTTASSDLRDFHGVKRMMLLDASVYLPDDILVKVDRAAMSASLETRVPFLDHEVVMLANRMQDNLKIRNGVGKWILREVLYRHLPRDLVDRPKMGFGVPIADWLRGPLREWAEALLNETRLTKEGYLHPQPIRRRWNEHLSGRRNWQHHLWTVLMFQAWLEENAKK